MTNQLTMKTTDSSIYYENQGTIKLQVTTWELITYYNLTNMHIDEQNFNKITMFTDKLCDQIQISYNTELYHICKKFHKQNQQILTDINYENTYLHDVLGPRIKRSLFNEVGNIAHILFSICDNICREHYDSQIRELGDDKS
jgi:hypothetical protein